MRRTLALVGAIALAATGLAGPAAADPGITAADVQLSEASVDFGATVGDAFVELRTLDVSQIQNLAGHQLIGCTTTSTFRIAEFSTSDVIDSANSRFFLVADSNYSGTALPDRSFEVAAQGELEQATGAAYLLDPNGNLLQGVVWGMVNDLHPDCEPNLDPSSVSPNNQKSISKNEVTGTWELTDRTPESQIG